MTMHRPPVVAPLRARPEHPRGHGWGSGAADEAPAGTPPGQKPQRPGYRATAGTRAGTWVDQIRANFGGARAKSPQTWPRAWRLNLPSGCGTAHFEGLREATSRGRRQGLRCCGLAAGECGRTCFDHCSPPQEIAFHTRARVPSTEVPKPTLFNASGPERCTMTSTPCSAGRPCFKEVT